MPRSRASWRRRRRRSARSPRPPPRRRGRGSCRSTCRRSRKQTRMIGGSPGRSGKGAGPRPSRRSAGLLIGSIEHHDSGRRRAEGRAAQSSQSWEAVAAAQQTGQPVKIVIAGHGDRRCRLPSWRLHEVDEVITVDADALASYTADGFTAAFAALVAAESPTHVFFTHTYQTRDFAPKLAARLDRALIADVVGRQAAGGRLRCSPGRCFRPRSTPMWSRSRARRRIW